jgi:iron complex outermembrane receptor protein
MRRHFNFKQTALSVAAAQAVLMWSGVAQAQDAPAPAAAASAPAGAKKKDEKETSQLQTVVVTGQRKALESAQTIKQNADEIVDSIVADDIGKLPDKSVTEVLQRIPGVAIDRTLNRADPQQGVGDGINHFAAEGTGVTIRGLSYVRSELNGRDSFSANGGRSLSFEDVPPELMSGVDVYKNPSAEQIEGAIGGLVNLRTAKPFDFKGSKGAFSVEASRSSLRGGSAQPSFSGLLSNTWDTDLGKFGALVDIAHSKIATHSDGLQISPYYPRTNAVVGDTSGQQRWVTPGGNWTSNDFDRTRDGQYAALQWRKDDVSSSLTYFRSKYKMRTTENAFFLGTDPSKLTVDPGATFDGNGALLTGTLHGQDVAPDRPDIGGIGFGTDSRVATRTADTRDISWNVEWNASPQWHFQSDLQYIKALSDGTDYTVGTGGWIPKQTVDLTGSVPRFLFDASDRAYLADPSNYYWGFAQEHRDHAEATEKAWRGDAKYTFDHPVLNDLRFGVRLTERSADTRSTHDSDWAQITQPWAVGNSWQPFSQLAWMGDPRFAGDNNLHAFNNFFDGKVPMPAAVVVPNMSVVNDQGFAKLHAYANVVCQVNPCWASWTPAKYGDDKGLNEQSERTQAAYSQLRFGFDDWAFPVDGNAGVRVVRTNSGAVGYTLFTPPTNAGPGVPDIPAQSGQQTFHNSYTNTLPSLNLRMKANKDLQFRFAASKGLTRPEFYQMQAYTTLTETPNTHTEKDAQGNTVTVLDSITYAGTARGNPMLKPTTSDNLDLTAEYYFGRTSSFTVAVFDKQLKDVIIGRTSTYTLNDTNGQPHDFAITAPVNGAKGRARGLEVGYQQYFDKLPGWLSGFGVSGNYTYIDSHLSMYEPVTSQWCTPKDTVDANLTRDLAGCDTNGHAIGSLPMTGLSRNSLNFALLYDLGPLSARLAYSWRSKYLQAVNAYGTASNDGIDQNPASPNKGNSYSVNFALPTWGGDYGQLDMGVQYKVTNDLTVAFEGQNLTNALYKQYMQQGIGLMERGAFYTGRRYTLQMRYSF